MFVPQSCAVAKSHDMIGHMVSNAGVSQNSLRNGIEVLHCYHSHKTHVGHRALPGEQIPQEMRTVAGSTEGVDGSADCQDSGVSNDVKLHIHLGIVFSL